MPHAGKRRIRRAGLSGCRVGTCHPLSAWPLSRGPHRSRQNRSIDVLKQEFEQAKLNALPVCREGVRKGQLSISSDCNVMRMKIALRVLGKQKPIGI